ncbi:MAG: hypothetical protein FOGNACKC_02279 [Anaerolineae bacterium]|nr:hypothetical protein [Anaerolineae bacterium]
MARGYKRYRIENFPELQIGQEIVTDHQLGMQFDTEEKDDQVHDVIKLLGYSEHHKFHKYQIWHEAWDSGIWRYQNQRLTRIISIQEMFGYLELNTPYMYIQRTKYSDSFMKRLAETYKEFHAYEREVDLYKLMDNLQGKKITGAWFGDLKIRDVRTAAIFGERVTTSDEWSRYNSRGKVTSVQVQISLNSGEFSVQLSRDGKITLQNAQNEREDMETLIGLEILIKPFVTRDDVAITL